MRGIESSRPERCCLARRLGFALPHTGDLLLGLCEDVRSSVCCAGFCSKPRSAVKTLARQGACSASRVQDARES